MVAQQDCDHVLHQHVPFRVQSLPVVGGVNGLVDTAIKSYIHTRDRKVLMDQTWQVPWRLCVTEEGALFASTFIPSADHWNKGLIVVPSTCIMGQADLMVYVKAKFC